MKNSFLTLLLAGTMLSLNAFDCCAQENAPVDAAEPQVHQKLSAEEMHKKMEERHQKMAEKLAEDLKLSDEQRQKAKEINENGRKEMEPMMEEMKNIREKMDTKRQENMQEFEKILTPEQKEKFDNIKKEHQDKWQDGRRLREDMPWRKKHMKGMPHHHGPKMGQAGAKADGPVTEAPKPENAVLAE